VSSSQLTEARDRVRSFGGYNNREVFDVRGTLAPFYQASEFTKCCAPL
jgi:hypothetical protein